MPAGVSPIRSRGSGQALLHHITYGTAWEHECHAALQDLLPEVELYDPATRYSSNATWRRAWPRVLETLSGLVLFASLDGTIGAGCMREVLDAVAWGIPVAGFGEGMLREIEGLQFLMPRQLTPWRTGRLLLGDQIDAAEFPLGGRVAARPFQSIP
jgi:hypothetical protein